jgi:chloride channel protein, CIC family
MTQPPFLKNIIAWQSKYIKHKNFVLLLSVAVGLVSGIVAVIIKNSVHFIQQLLTGSFVRDYENYLYFAYPLVGLLLTVTIVKYIVKRPVRHGIPNTLYSISKRSGNVRVHNLYSSVITSAVTVGFGGSTGLEGPSVVTSAAWGSNIGRSLRLDHKTKVLLIGCAAAGAISSLFNAPIAALIFSIEIFMLDLTMTSLIPLLLASLSAVITSRLFMGNDVLFHFPVESSFSVRNLPFYALLGIFAGLISIYFTKMYFFFSIAADKVRSDYLKAVIGGLVLGALIFVFPSLYGEGYETINALIGGNYEQALYNSPFYFLKGNTYVVLLFLAGMVFIKPIATALTLAAGGIGGTFAPSLFLGSATGFVFSKAVNFFGAGNIPESNFTLAGMAGVMAGIMHAPLTAIFLIAEITRGYELFIPLMMTSAIAYITVKYFVPNSIYTMELAKRGQLITHDKDQAVLTLMKLHNEIETNFETIHPDQTLEDLVKVVRKSKRNLFPVIDEKEALVGVVSLDNIRDIMFNQEVYKTMRVHELMTIPPGYISSGDSMDAVMKKFEETGAWNLPVVDEGKYAGFVSKSKLFSAYRNLLTEFYGTK